jgi:hypothetical protein
VKPINLTQFTPRPPIELHTNGVTAETVFLVVILVLTAALVMAAAYLTRRWRTWIPLLAVVGGGLTIFLEPIVDAQLQVWWPTHHQSDVIHLWGRHIPIMILPVVTLYFGVGVILRLYWLNKYGPRTRLWTIFLVEVVLAIALEPPAINLNLWHYYGFQGLRFFGYPIWWPFTGGASAMAAGTLVYKLTPYLTGWRVVLAAPLVPMGVAAGYWGVGWPMFDVLNGHPAHGAVYPVAFVSIALSFLVVWICTIATGQYDYRRRAREAAASSDEAAAAPAEMAVS